MAGDPETLDYTPRRRGRAEVILGCTLIPSELRPALTRIIDEVPRLVRVHLDDHTNQKRNKARFSAPKGDVRDDDDWKAAHGKGGDGWAYDANRFYWLNDVSNGMIKRQFYSHIDADSSSVRVHADCNESEVKYAIEQIRKRQEAVSDSVGAS